MIMATKVIILIIYITIAFFRLNIRGENFRNEIEVKYPELFKKYFIISLRNPYHHLPGVFNGIEELVSIPEIRRMQISYTLETYGWIVGLLGLLVLFSLVDL
jgi:hypothetical protein